MLKLDPIVFHLMFWFPIVLFAMLWTWEWLAARPIRRRRHHVAR